MTSIFNAMAKATRDLLRPRVLAVLLLPMLGAIVIWSLLAVFYWSAWTSAMESFMRGTAWAQWIAAHGAAWLVQAMSVVLVIAWLVPAVLITAVLITELVAMPVVVSTVARSYPRLERLKGGSAIGSLTNAAAAVSIFALLWLATLPLWLTGIGALLLPALNSGYLNQRLFRYDALSEHASREEYRQLIAGKRRELYGLGLVLAPLYYVPLLNLAAPVLSGLAFTHYCLAELERLRFRETTRDLKALKMDSVSSPQ